ncbi:glutamate--cysteine ligase [Pseudonocardia sp. HH130630-07]|uniref:glutamate--cysteine ligase n=1 Tax=Pseudonocardia sp. HH130630-07 TaxID=1690815 RepID=UPI000814CC23|nr:glutamate--cysteine ligase [Pseudonocardia sp. HH130630-07]ANY09892.1 glutamate--cysteine ligase [Pseudonocardia sp. HH130630-07]
MGQVVDRTTFTRRDRQRYRIKVQRCLDSLAELLRSYPFGDTDPMTGVEIEFNLVDPQLAPSLNGNDVLETISSGEWQTELGRWNLELNLPPRPLPGDQWRQLEHELLDLLAGAGAKAGDLRTQFAMIGILPTLDPSHMTGEAITPDDRYRALNDQMLNARGEPVRIDITGSDPDERVNADFDTIIPEAACTSMQLHLQVAPADFGRYWNAAQCLAGVQLGLGANSPFLLGSQLWAETRIPLFEQACDVRTPELHNQGVRPRVWFGERWIDSVLDLFSENARYFPALMPLTTDIDPAAQMREQGFPELPELTLHNGTIWRWNRPIYDSTGRTPHVRLENRVLPAGPTTVDMVANALFFYGLLRTLVESDQQLWRSVSFEAARENFQTAARHGMDAPLYWPGTGWIRPDELTLRKLLPLAHEGLARWGVGSAVCDRYLTVLERRCVTRQTGASWQVDAVAALEARGADRMSALHGMLDRYLAQSAANQPVHTWELPS